MNEKIDHVKIALLVLIVAGTLSYAQNEVRRGRDRVPAIDAEAPADESKLSAPTLNSAITDANRASKIIGMEVRDRADARIGRVKDIVIDGESGRVAYAVLASEALGEGKLIAVPIDALRWRPEARDFMVDLPRERLAVAPGFADDDWPALDATNSREAIGLAGASGESSARGAIDRSAPSQSEESKKRP